LHQNAFVVLVAGWKIVNRKRLS